jgi:hexosaminidase
MTAAPDGAPSGVPIVSRLALAAGAAGLLLASAPHVHAQDVPAIRVVPQPEHVELRDGHFVLADSVSIALASREPRMTEVAELLADVIRRRTGFAVTVDSADATGASIVLEERGGLPDDERYELTVSPRQVRVTAASARGVFWGVQTLRQLLPPEFEDPRGARPPSWTIPAVEIRDAPKFAWRGSLLDVGRHFFPVEFVERYIDLLSRYKMNVLHWHLTEDQGWRIEIAKYPRLTEVGAWRTEADGSRYGGYYTQDEIRRVVEYARLRNVTVVPEIEMPGHSQAAIAAYPELGCTGDSVPVATQWGVMKEIYCAGNPRTFTFLEDVLDEVMALFPSEYIHIGGDEVPKDRWKSCASCQALMRREGLSDEAELQSWFVRRIERYLNRHGRKLIGWDEILEGGLSPTATVQVWRDMAHASAAVRQGARVIASPTSHAYFDGSPRTLPLERVYQFDPTPPDLDSLQFRHVLGGEANIWTEYITTANFDVMVFPRLLAMSEALWSRAPRDYAGFLARLRADHYPRLRTLGVHIGPEHTDVVRLTTQYDSATQSAVVVVEKGVDELTVRYTTDGSTPTTRSPIHHDSIRFDRAATITLQPFIGPEPLPIARTFTIVQHLARGTRVAQVTPNSRQYPGTGTFTLTDGLLGSVDHHDGLWQGWIGRDLEAVIDLGSVTTIHSIGASFLQAVQSWILLPKRVELWLSEDGVDWTSVTEVTHDIPAERDERFRHTFEIAVPGGVRARYVKVTARNYGTLPDWHAGAGRPAWIFADEIVVR